MPVRGKERLVKQKIKNPCMLLNKYGKFRARSHVRWVSVFTCLYANDSYGLLRPAQAKGKPQFQGPGSHPGHLNVTLQVR